MPRAAVQHSASPERAPATDTPAPAEPAAAGSAAAGDPAEHPLVRQTVDAFRGKVLKIYPKPAAGQSRPRA